MRGDKNLPESFAQGSGVTVDARFLIYQSTYKKRLALTRAWQKLARACFCGSSRPNGRGAVVK